MRVELVRTKNFSLEIDYTAEDFDYYSNIILELVDLKTKTKIMIFKDNLLELYNIVRRYKDEGIPELPQEIDDHSLGVMLNDIYQNDSEDKNNIEKYCAYIYLDCATWLFCKEKTFRLQITPMYQDGADYKEFRKNCCTVFASEIDSEELKRIADSIEELYKKLM